MTLTPTETATTWRCPRCETVAGAGQRFCRRCGHQHATDEAGDPSGEIDRTGPMMRPVSRLLIVMIVVLFVALGALAALLVDDIRHEPDQSPTTTDGASGLVVDIGTRPITNTD